MGAQIFHPPKHAVSIFMDSISSVEPDDDLDAVDSIMPIVIKITFDVAHEVWDDAFLRKVVIGCKENVGTNMILQEILSVESKLSFIHTVSFASLSLRNMEKVENTVQHKYIKH